MVALYKKTEEVSRRSMSHHMHFSDKINMDTRYLFLNKAKDLPFLLIKEMVLEILQTGT
jgi:hypothetical protein